MWLGAPQTTPGRRGEETRWFFPNPRRMGPQVKMPWAGAVVAQGAALEPGRGEQAEALHLSSAPHQPPAGAGCWVLGWSAGDQGIIFPGLAQGRGAGEWVEGAGWLCGEQRHSHEGKGPWGQRGTQERRRQICRRACLPWVPGECKLQGSNYTKSRNPLLDP